MKDNQWESKFNQPNNSLVIDYPYCWKPPQKDEKPKIQPTIILDEPNNQSLYPARY